MPLPNANMAVHPRVCGEQFGRRAAGHANSGSSPRVRGTGHRVSPKPQPFPVHPRVCGEQPIWTSRIAILCGSSPRVRGTAEIERGLTSKQRFIPACAGNSRYGDRREDIQAVHPRVCGEQSTIRDSASSLSGSSPRVRGTGTAMICVVIRIGSSPRVRGTGPLVTPLPASRRFIPACAGNSREVRGQNRHGAVHPRVCGEQSPAPQALPLGCGSSPRVRGTEHTGDKRLSFSRFIPACAGNRIRCTSTACALTVHPRVCGEQVHWSRHCQPRGGSSPRVRGTAAKSEAKTDTARFIPACAGNSHPRPKRCPWAAVHPRVCGEQEHTGDKRLSFSRFIPACAGNRIRCTSTACALTVHPRVCGEQLPVRSASLIGAGSSPRVRGTVNGTF